MSASGGGGADKGGGSSGSSGGLRAFFSKLKKTSGGSNPGMGNGASNRSGGPSSANLKISVGNKMMDAGEVQKLIPQLEKTIAQKEETIHAQEKTIDGQLKKIAHLESEVKHLQSECDKLRSVLEQKADSVIPANVPKTSRSSDEMRASLQQQANMVGQQDSHKWAKKIAVSAEPVKALEGQAQLEHHKKSAGAKQLIRDAIQQNDFLRQLDHQQMIEMVECMYEKSVRGGEWVIKEGDAGSHLYVAADGELQVVKSGNVLGKMGPGRVFGELAILYNCTRTASVKAMTDVNLWVLDRLVFQMITQKMGMDRHNQLMAFLRSVSLFKNLSEDRVSKMADVLEQDFYKEGTYIVRQHEKGDTFFVINSGEVRVTQLVEGSDEPQLIRTLTQGDFFGEKALLGEEVRTASVIAGDNGVEVLTLDRESFHRLIGDLKEIHKDYGDELRPKPKPRPSEEGLPREITRERESDVSIGKVPTGVSAEYAEVQLGDVKVLGTLGVGGFGRVEMVYLKADKTKNYALKALKKKHIVDTRQQEHIFSERNIMMELNSEWIVRLYRTFRDKKYVYMLLEVCLGGELWTCLRDRGHFDDFTARFYVACVLEGLEFVHRKRIIYRDLKPENCLLNEKGYLKLVDFGFAKKLAGGRKTWTFCGTPEYVSPEIILNKGHDQAADYWALGIYICELLLGRPPFQAQDPMKTYTLILKGVDALDIPNRRIGKTATALVKKLCRDNPAERLGCGSGGVDDIRKHRWFMGFDWDGLRSRLLRPPILPKVSGPGDISNFDHYPPDNDVPPDEFSGWDEGF